MSIKITNVDMSEERKIVTNMIISTPFLMRLEQVLEVGLFDSQYAKIVAMWVLDYYKITKKAPSAEIQEIYQRKREDLKDEESTMVSKFLTSISEEYTRQDAFNVDYAKANAEKWLQMQAVKRLQGKLSSAITDGNVQLAERIIGEYKKITSTKSRGMDLLRDVDSIFDAINSTEEELFSFKGALGKIMSPICRGDFVGIGAPAKRGKSWMLYCAAKEAQLAGLNVLVLSLEMMEKQSTRRMWQMVCGAPIKDGDIVVPYFIQGANGWEIEPKRKRMKGLRSWTKEEILEQQKKIILRSRGGSIKMQTYPTKSFSVDDLKTVLFNLENYENWIPDVVVVDYADIMRSSSRDNEERNKINEVWLALRGLAQQRMIAIITASQTGRATFKEGKDAGSDDIAEDIRKIAHCTKFVFLNQTLQEKAVGIMRAQCTIQREGATINDCAVILQCLDCGVPHIQSKLSREVAGMEWGKPFNVSPAFMDYFTGGN